MMRDGEPQIYGGYEIHMTDIGYDVRRNGSTVSQFDTLADAYDWVDAEESGDTRWEVIKIEGDTEEFGKWAVYPPGVGWYGGWTDLCDTWEQAQAQADARAHGRV